jgi:hypothetical protein
MVSGRASALHVLLLALAVTWARPAQADDAVHSARLIWQRAPGAEGCIGEDELRERVASHLGTRLGDEHDALVIEGSIAPRASGAGFTAQLTVAGDAQGARKLSARGSDCRALDDALVLVVAAAIEALAPSRAPIEDEPAEPAVGTAVAPDSFGAARGEPASAPRPERTARVEPKRQEKPREPVRPTPIVEDDAIREAEPPAREDAEAPSDPAHALRLSLGPRLSAGLMPAAAGGAALALLWPLSDTLRAELGASLWPLGTRPTDRGDADFQAARLDALLCTALPITRALHALACGGVSAGALRAQGDFDHGSRASLRPLAGVVSWLFAELSLTRDAAWRIRAGGGLSFELWRDRFAARDALGRQVLLHRVAQVIGLVGVELSAAL